MHPFAAIVGEEYAGFGRYSVHKWWRHEYTCELSIRAEAGHNYVVKAFDNWDENVGKEVQDFTYDWAVLIFDSDPYLEIGRVVAADASEDVMQELHRWEGPGEGLRLYNTFVSNWWSGEVFRFPDSDGATEEVAMNLAPVRELRLRVRSHRVNSP